MGIPLAVQPSVRTPGLALLINMLAAPVSPGTAPLRALILAPKGSQGTITPDSQLVQGLGGEGNAATYLGAGTPGHLAAKALYTEYPLAQVDLAAPTAPAGDTATATIVFDDAQPITSPQTVQVEIAGRVVEIVWQVGETKVQAATKLVTAVGLQTRDLPVTAANGGGALATTTLSAKIAGNWGNDITLALTVKDGAGGSVSIGGGATALAGGTTDVNLTNVLSLVSGKEYDYILVVTSNADAQAASASSGPGRVKTHITTHATGFNAKLQQAVVGLTGALAAAKTGAAQHNFGDLQYVFCQAGRSLPCEWGGAEVGARMREEQPDPNVNRMRSTYRATLYGARDLVADALTDAEVEDALFSGLSPIGYDATDAPIMIRPVTTYFKDGSGNPDDRILDVGRPTSLKRVAKDLRVSLPQAFPKAKLIKDLEPGDDDPPEGVIEERDVKAFVVDDRLAFWVKKGVVRRDKLAAAVADGSLIVKVDDDDEHQCDIVLPLSIVPALAKWSVVVNQA